MYSLYDRDEHMSTWQVKKKQKQLIQHDQSNLKIAVYSKLKYTYTQTMHNEVEHLRPEKYHI